MLEFAGMAKHKPRVRAGKVAASFIRRLLWPGHVRRWARHFRRRGKSEATQNFGQMAQQLRGKEQVAFENPQLALYSQILPGGFLHYGYFDDPEVVPEQLSLDDLVQAQMRYTENVLEHVLNREAPVLDVGAGMGGVSRVLQERGFKPVALTPDRVQVRYIEHNYPDIPVIEGRFNEVGWVPHYGRYGTVLTAESFQYLFLDNAMTTIGRLLRPGGRWVVCDFFRRNGSVRGSGHLWEGFLEAAERYGWRLVVERDITDNVIPSMAFVRMLGDRFAMPLFGFIVASLRRNHPVVHYLLSEGFDDVESLLSYNVDQIDPALFRSQKRYMLLVLERADGD